MRTDLHVHLLGASPEHGCLLGAKFRRTPVFKAIARGFGFGWDTTLENIDGRYATRLAQVVQESELDACGILALDGVYDPQGRLDVGRTQVMVGNDYCLEVCAGEEKMWPVCSVNPQRGGAIEELHRVMEAGALPLLKVLPNSQGFDPACPRYVPFWQEMAKLGVALLSHASFEHTIPPIDQRWGDPKRLAAPLSQGVTVIAAHCGGSGVAHPLHEDFDVWLGMLKDHPNLYGDISAMASVSRFPYIHRVLASELALERVIFGSDFPVPAHPLLFAKPLGLARARALSKIENPLTMQVRLMEALGVPEAVMSRGVGLLGLVEPLNAS